MAKTALFNRIMAMDAKSIACMLVSKRNPSMALVPQQFVAIGDKFVDYYGPGDPHPPMGGVSIEPVTFRDHSWLKWEWPYFIGGLPFIWGGTQYMRPESQPISYAPVPGRSEFEFMLINDESPIDTTNWLDVLQEMIDRRDAMERAGTWI